MPPAMRDPFEPDRRAAMLTLPHVQGLAAYVAKLSSEGFFVPAFDPLDGGICARALFLFEKPGRKTVPPKGSGFISRDNDDPTAENTYRFMEDARIPREKIVIWNVVPGWDGTRTITAPQLREGIQALHALRTLLPRLACYMLVGRRAQQAASFLKDKPVFCSAHPSNIVRNTNRALWDAIPRQWAQVLPYLD